MYCRPYQNQAKKVPLQSQRRSSHFTESLLVIVCYWICLMLSKWGGGRLSSIKNTTSFLVVQRRTIAILPFQGFFIICFRISQDKTREGLETSPPRSWNQYIFLKYFISAVIKSVSFRTLWIWLFPH